jgi:hypothetical protein
MSAFGSHLSTWFGQAAQRIDSRASQWQVRGLPGCGGGDENRHYSGMAAAAGMELAIVAAGAWSAVAILAMLARLAVGIMAVVLMPLTVGKKYV